MLLLLLLPLLLPSNSRTEAHIIVVSGHSTNFVMNLAVLIGMCVHDSHDTDSARHACKAASVQSCCTSVQLQRLITVVGLLHPDCAAHKQCALHCKSA